MSVGGTSGNPASSGNLFSINLGGLSSTFDLGPSTSTVANQAYAFLNNSWNNDSAFLGGAITGSQNLVQSVTQPVIDMAEQQQQVNDNVLPGMFSALNAQNFTLGQESINAEQQVAQASIASSNANAAEANNSGGGCYITTAVCEALNLPDDCHTLKTLRAFRDNYMMQTNVRRAFVEEYYKTAPRLVEAIRQREDARMYFQQLYTDYILPALLSIEGGNLDRAFAIYRRMLYHVRSCIYG